MMPSIARVPLLALALVAVGACQRTNPAPAPAPQPMPSAQPMPPAQPAQPAEREQTPREKADELFNAAMMALEGGDKQTAGPATALALMAYKNLGEPDTDTLYHMALLQAGSGDFAAARQSAKQILDKHPTHLLALGIAAEAASGAGDAKAALAFRKKLLESFDAEIAANRVPEYGHHSRILPIYRERAQNALK